MNKIKFVSETTVSMNHQHEKRSRKSLPKPEEPKKEEMALIKTTRNLKNVLEICLDDDESENEVTSEKDQPK